ncbi:unnamed protein product [Discosporangium mesarthrocarpum]
MHLTATLKSFGFEQSEADPCLFRYMDEEEVPLLVVTHVDDMIAAGSVGDCDALCEALSTEPLTLINCVNDLTCPLLVLYPPLHMSRQYPDRKMSHKDLRNSELIGALLWAVCMSRPDISNPVRALARYSQDPSKAHWHQGIKILRYLLGTRTWGINHKRGLGQELFACADSSYVGDSNDRRSVSGEAIMFGGGTVSCFSRTQRKQ